MTGPGVAASDFLNQPLNQEPLDAAAAGGAGADEFKTNEILADWCPQTHYIPGFSAAGVATFSTVASSAVFASALNGFGFEFPRPRSSSSSSSWL